jgi:hypothetical protein
MSEKGKQYPQALEGDELGKKVYDQVTAPPPPAPEKDLGNTATAETVELPEEPTEQ